MRFEHVVPTVNVQGEIEVKYISTVGKIVEKYLHEQIQKIVEAGTLGF